LGLFAEPGFVELTLWRDGRRLHRLIVTPRWFRFPFMGSGDLQLGDLWTDPAARGQGLARAAITEALRLARHADRVWYLVDARNDASARLAESVGFQLYGAGRRTRPLGLHLAGRFRLDPT
jgi:RimJ/RimL family protein N-acetyltransferase